MCQHRLDKSSILYADSNTPARGDREVHGNSATFMVATLWALGSWLAFMYWSCFILLVFDSKKIESLLLPSDFNQYSNKVLLRIILKLIESVVRSTLDSL